jgi:hypothetical protein
MGQAALVDGAKSRLPPKAHRLGRDAPCRERGEFSRAALLVCHENKQSQSYFLEIFLAGLSGFFGLLGDAILRRFWSRERAKKN